MAKSKETKIREFLDRAMKEFDRCYKKEKKNREKYREDVKFSLGEDQWDATIAKERSDEGRPCLAFDVLTKPIRKLVGEIRHNMVQAHVKPVDSAATADIALLRSGLIRDAEYKSNADQIFDYAGEMVVRGGFGAWELLTRYTEDNPFIQEFYLKRIRNPMAVYLDANCDNENHDDAMHGFKIAKMGLDRYKEKYGDDLESPGETLKGEAFGLLGKEHWWDAKDGGLVMVADYFRKVPVKDEICLLSDGRVMSKKDAEKAIQDNKAQITAWDAIAQISSPPGGTAGPSPMMPPSPPAMAGQLPSPSPIPMGPMPDGMGMPSGAQPPQMPQLSQAGIQLPQPGPRPKELTIKRVKESTAYKIKHWVISASDIVVPKKGAKDSEGNEIDQLEGEDFPGSTIPLFIAQGPEIDNDGEPVVLSFIRGAKDPVRSYNYWVTAGAEAVALAPKAPWVATPEQTKGFEEMYASANRKNYPVIWYNPHIIEGPNVLVPPPQRNPGAAPPVGMFAEADRAKAAVEDALGMTDRDVMGRVGPERSGDAITATQKPSEISNFQFFDNLVREITRTYRAMNDMIPDVYDSERDVMVRDVDGSEFWVPVNTDARSALERMEQNPDRYRGMSIKQLREQIVLKGDNALYNDLKAGKYGVHTKVGPAYATQRQEAARMTANWIQGDPKAKSLVGDIYWKNVDVPDAGVIAERYEMQLPGPMRKETPGKPQKKMPPNPMIIAKMEEVKVKQSKVAVEREKVQVARAKVRVEEIKALKELADTQKGVEKSVIKILSKLYADEHPADGIPGPQGSAPVPEETT